MQIRPLEPADAAAVQALATRPEVACWTATTPYEETEAWAERLADGGDAWLWFGAWRGDAVAGYLKVQFHHRRRAVHLARLYLGGEPAALEALAVEAARLGDAWLSTSRLEAHYEPTSPQAAALVAAGFTVEATRRQAAFRDGSVRDLALYGRLRPGWAPPPAPEMVWPVRPGDRAAITLRPLRAADAAEAAAFHRQRSVLAGTMMTPGMTATRWRGFAPNLHRLAAEVDGAVVGVASMRQIEHAGVHGLGMAVDERYQGRGVGGALLDALLALGDGWLNLRRTELEVYVDNTRAQALYRSRGFEPEGVRRAAAMREGGYADSLVMGRLTAATKES